MDVTCVETCPLCYCGTRVNWLRAVSTIRTSTLYFTVYRWRTEMSRLLQISAIKIITFYVSNFVVVGPMARFHI